MDQRPAGIIGHFDGIDGSRASGWVSLPGSPERILDVEFFSIAADGRSTLLGRTRANRPREDLRAIGLVEIRHGFEWRPPHPSAPSLVSARVADGGIELPGSPVRLEPGPVYEGCLDGIVHGVLRGWAWAWAPDFRVTVEIFVDGSAQATVSAEAERRDLMLSHVGNGRHGFAWMVPERFADGKPHEYACRIAGTSFRLPGSPYSAAVQPADRRFAETSLDLVRGCERRPARMPSGHPTHDGWRHWPFARIFGRGARLQPSVMRETEPETIAAASRGEFWRPLGDAAAASSRPPEPAIGRQLVRMLIPVWGDDYIRVFCQSCLPSFLSANNLPYLAGAHDVTVVFLTRRTDHPAFAQFPAFRRLAQLVDVVFHDIDEVLARYFEPYPDSFYAALTYAYFDGIRAVGAESAILETNFLFWNADFLPADGVFRTLADLIAAGTRCTIAPSLRVDIAVEDAVLVHRRTEEGAVLDIGPREWVRLALRFPHPTVKAQTINRFEERMIMPISQLYWYLNDEQMVARQFFMFMLHIRPERMWSEIYGHCDYVFVPEMVPSSDYHFEVTSDRMLIIELQHHNRDLQNIAASDEPITAEDVALPLAQWTTREHVLNSRQLVLFDAGETPIDVCRAQETTDELMNAVYDRMPKAALWHNGHFCWRQNLGSLGVEYREPGPDHPRSYLAGALRWTGYDIDILRESWPGEAPPPDELFGLALPLPAQFDVSAWLAGIHARYHAAWAGAEPPLPFGEMDLISGRFHGFGWGLVERCGAGWSRRLGPDRRAMLLLRVPPRPRRLRISLFAGADDEAALGNLLVYVNGRKPDRALYGSRGRRSMLRLELERGRVERAGGGLQVLICATPTAEPVAFTEVRIG
jgi:hypothetical protein